MHSWYPRAIDGQARGIGRSRTMIARNGSEYWETPRYSTNAPLSPGPDRNERRMGFLPARTSLRAARIGIFPCTTAFLDPGVVTTHLKTHQPRAISVTSGRRAEETARKRAKSGVAGFLRIRPAQIRRPRP